jgi:hypothetical protein
MRNHSGNPDKIAKGSANPITLYKHVYMMRLALPYMFDATRPHNKALHLRETSYIRQHKIIRHLNGVTSCNNSYNH